MILPLLLYFPVFSITTTYFCSQQKTLMRKNTINKLKEKTEIRDFIIICLKDRFMKVGFFLPFALPYILTLLILSVDVVSKLFRDKGKLIFFH